MCNTEGQQSVTNYNKSNSISSSITTTQIIKELNETVILTETFYILINRRQKRYIKVKVELNERGIYIRRESVKCNQIAEQLIRIEDIVGSSCSPCLRKPQRTDLNYCKRTHDIDLDDQQQINKSSYDEPKECSVYLYIYAYVRKENPSQRYRTVRILKFGSFQTYEDNLKAAKRWQQTIQLNKQLPIDMLHNERKPLLILLNPKSGSGRGRQMFQTQVVPVLKEAEIPYELIVTTHANYARELIKQRKDLIESYSGIVVASGDGLFHEVLNGLMENTNWHCLARNLPLGIIPCGSGNGLAKSIAHYYDEPYESDPILNCTLTCVSSKTAPLDVVLVETIKKCNTVQMYSFLSVGWGFIADIDIESEKLRAFGSQRFTIWSLYRLLHLKTYKGKLSYLRWCQQQLERTTERTHISATNKESDKEESFQDVLEDDNSLFYDALLDDDEQYLDILSQATSKSINNSWQSRRTAFYSAQESYSTSSLCNNAPNNIEITNKHMISVCQKSCLPPMDCPIPEEWLSEEGEYIMVHATNTTHLAADCFFAPNSKLNDGIIYLVIIRAGISRAQLLNFLLKLNSGAHLSIAPETYLEVVPVKAFRLEPQDSDGIITVDGERIDYGPLQAEILPGLIQVMVPNVTNK